MKGDEVGDLKVLYHGLQMLDPVVSLFGPYPVHNARGRVAVVAL